MCVMKDVLNQMLPVNDNDVDMLAGGILSASVLLESLMQTKKRLAIKRYCEFATRLVTPATFPPWILYGV